MSWGAACLSLASGCSVNWKQAAGTTRGAHLHLPTSCCPALSAQAVVTPRLPPTPHHHHHSAPLEEEERKLPEQKAPGEDAVSRWYQAPISLLHPHTPRSQPAGGERKKTGGVQTAVHAHRRIGRFTKEVTGDSRGKATGFLTPSMQCSLRRISSKIPDTDQVPTPVPTHRLSCCIVRKPGGANCSQMRITSQ